MWSTMISTSVTVAPSPPFRKIAFVADAAGEMLERGQVREAYRRDAVGGDDEADRRARRISGLILDDSGNADEERVAFDGQTRR